ncbi:hypothetical protein JW964_08895, partial [candidate division KSB1 bacterium]|nr:hypothetical protein [candidate division KSB1 bacterium]
IGDIYLKLQSNRDKISNLLNGLKNYFETKDDYSKNDKMISQAEKVISQFEKYHSNQEKLEKIKSKLIENESKYKQYKLLSNSFEPYNEINNKIRDANKILQFLLQKSIELSEEKKKHELQLIEISTIGDKQLSKIEDYEFRINEIQNNYNNFKMLSINKNEAESELEKLKKEKEEQVTEIKNLLLDFDILKENLQIEQKVELGIKAIHPKFNDRYLVCVNLDEKIKDSRLQFEDLTNQYKQIIELNTTYEKLIEFGKMYIEQERTNVCPLCNEKQDDFETLLKLVTKQKIDSSTLDKISEKKHKIKFTIDNLITEYRNTIEAIKKQIKNEIENISGKIQIENKEKNKKDDRINVCENQISLIERQINDIINFFKIKNVKFLEGTVTQLISGIVTKKREVEILSNETEKNIKNIELKLKDTKRKIIDNDSEIEKTKRQLEQLKYNQIFLEVRNLISSLGLEPLDDSEIILEHIKEIQLKISDLNDQYKDVNGRNKMLKTEIEKYNLEKINESLSQLKNKGKALKNVIENYQKSYSEVIKEHDIQKDLIEEVQKNVLVEFDSVKIIKEKIDEIVENLKYAREMIEYSNIKNDILKLDKDIERQEEIIRELESVQETGKQFIREKIENYFNSKTINEIYKRIQPHPEFTIIEFVPDFSAYDSKPELRIMTTDKYKQKDSIDPLIYNSSGQINLLSLSIFLAKALQYEDNELNTIFMDDPVQNLDSINVLSFIDLLRTIITEHDRQIVMSTHDENLFRLIQKKMDPQFFKTKFIELESFGKLKRN